MNYSISKFYVLYQKCFDGIGILIFENLCKKWLRIERTFVNRSIYRNGVSILYRIVSHESQSIILLLTTGNASNQIKRIIYESLYLEPDV